MSGTPTCPFKTDAGVFGVKSDTEGRIYRPNPEDKKNRRVYEGYRGKYDGSCLCMQNTLKREEKPGLVGPSKLPLASLQFCERTCVFPQEPVLFIYIYTWLLLKPTWLAVHKNVCADWKQWKKSCKCELVLSPLRTQVVMCMHWIIFQKRRETALFWMCSAHA